MIRENRRADQEHKAAGDSRNEHRPALEWVKRAHASQSTRSGRTTTLASGTEQSRKHG